MTATREQRAPRHVETATHTAVDRGPGLVHGGYSYLLRLRAKWHATSAELRILGRRTTVLSGPEGVQLFYNEAIMRRSGALPGPLQRTLFGAGAVHGLDDEQHQHRKAMFVDLLTPEAARGIAGLAAELWQAPGNDCALDPVGAFDAAVAVHCAAVCRWAGVPEAAVDATLARDLAAIVDGFGSLGRRQLQARRARRRVDRWAWRLISEVRRGRADVDAASPLAAIAAATGPSGALLRPHVAGVEVINILRPTVAVAYFVAFAAHALQTQPGLRKRLADADDSTYEAFAHEVRRYYPFVPMLAARVRRKVTFQGRPLEPGRRVLLDVYGTLHDPQLWDAPERFDVDRFRDRFRGCPHAGPEQDYYVPQGGGDVRSGHRCPGERVAIELIKTAARCMVATPPPEVPAHIPLNRLPTRPLADRR